MKLPHLIAPLAVVALLTAGPAFASPGSRSGSPMSGMDKGGVSAGQPMSSKRHRKGHGRES